MHPFRYSAFILTIVAAEYIFSSYPHIHADITMPSTEASFRKNF